MTYLGAPYRRGGRDPRGLDCSGLVQLVFAQESIPLPRTCQAQARVGQPVPVSDAQPGDLLFFAEGRSTVTHVGIYAGRGEFIHASTGAGHVRIDELDDRYFSVRLREARRVIPAP
jgi:cell wall-associated NlpC family hydrolase